MKIRKLNCCNQSTNMVILIQLMKSYAKIKQTENKVLDVSITVFFKFFINDKTFINTIDTSDKVRLDTYP